MRIFLIVSLLCLVMGCQFDGDARYYPVTKGGFLLVESNGKEILAVKGQEMIRNWEASWSSLGGAVSDMAGKEGTLWLASAEGKSIVEIDMETESLVRTISTDSISPHYLAAGDQYLLLSDTTEKKIGFLNLQTETLISMEVDAVPGTAIYVAPAFYLIQGEKEVGIYHEAALALLTTLSLPEPAFELAFDYRQTVLCLLRPSSRPTLSQIGINVNSFQLWDQAEDTEWLKIRYSPYKTALYGKEWTKPARKLSDGKLAPSAFEIVDDFEIDFFESRYYYTSRDSLFSYSISAQIRDNLSPFSGKLLKSFYFIAPTDP